MLLLASVGEYSLFFEPLGKIEFHGRVIYALEGFVDVGLQLHVGSAGMPFLHFVKGENHHNWY